MNPKINRLPVLICGVVLILSSPTGLPGKNFERDRLFDSEWLFYRGDIQGAESPEFDDSTWRVIDLPHDWSIEDLPPRTNFPPELPIVPGQWRFQKGDDPAWKEPDYDDSSWQIVTLPNTWERHSGYTNDNAYGWYRKRITIPDEFKGTNFILLLGLIDDVDETFFNGVRIGATGSFPPQYQSAWATPRRYEVPASLVRGDGSDLIAVRVYDATGVGGIYEQGVKSERIGPFDTSLSEGGTATGYVVGGRGWYRKHFVLKPQETGKRISVRFDGVYMNADFWINGHYLGNHPYGYTSFEFELTPYLRPPRQTNVLAVQVKNEGKNSRWYSGSGIYRHVWLTITDRIYIPTWGVFITTPEVSPEKAIVKISTEVCNSTSTNSDVLVNIRILNPRKSKVKEVRHPIQIPPNTTQIVEQNIEVQTPELWSTESPSLYTAEVTLLTNNKVLDKVSTRFGIRKVEIDAQNGLRLNGKPIKLLGGCVHHDNGPLGAAAIDRAERRRVELIKANGFNAVRTAHNPPSPAFLDACDELGILVIDEAFDCWNIGKNPHDYHLYFKEWALKDIASMVRRDRNHPSVIMWSIGNEIPDQFQPLGQQTAKMLRDAVLSHDPTRPITQAICSDWGEVMRNWDRLSDPAFVHLDVAGYNYLLGKYESDHRRHPNRVIMGTESFPRDAFDCWQLMQKHPYVIGDFVWTAMDYLGETGIGHAILSTETESFLRPWPWIIAWCGDLDICGFKKPQSYYRDVVWGRSQLEIMVHVPLPEGTFERVSSWGWPNELPSWTWPGCEGKNMEVTIYSRCEKVRLELNGRIIGEKPVTPNSKLKVKFSVPYEPGQLRALGLIADKPVAEKVLKTAGPPKKIRLSPDRVSIQADRNDLCYVTVEITDERGLHVPYAEMSIQFTVKGAGELAAVGTGAPNKPASFRTPKLETYLGRGLVILRPTGKRGKITLKAEGPGLRPATTTVTVQ